jgi:ferredoxin
MKCLARWDDLRRLLSLLEGMGHTLHGPTLREGDIVIDEIRSADDLPLGWTDVQEPGVYRLEKHPLQLVFGLHPGPQPWKKLLLPPRVTLWEGRRTGSGFETISTGGPAVPMAFIGVRGCDVTGISRLDRVFELSDPAGAPGRSCSSPPSDPAYADRRRATFIVGVQCIQAGSHCFCTSVGSGPRIRSGCDLVLTEIPDGVEGSFHVESLTPRGVKVLNELSLPGAGPEDTAGAQKRVEACASAMPRALDASGIREMLERQWENRRWEETARRCLTCGNCTLVCPTCFCTTVLDETDLAGETARRTRQWDSCFSLEFTYVHGGGNVRTSAKSRYRHWMMHKLATWHDQFGDMGCVGCGRCITWCPAGIDITEEAAAMRRSDGARGPTPEEKCHVRL